ncbi:MAG: phosphoserine phosphatase RsbU/P [Chthoniobacter sp.]|jgi:serine phosphatase RsbU (regulator of sigma subunit)|nr:phosphoserine phosphatase RsbU/P [Chthoniobacter sp.]
MSEVAPSTRGVEILIVEDSLTQAMKLEHILQRHAHHVTLARNGEEALNAVQQSRPRLVITDINMPKMDGYELCRRIKDDPVLKELPVILLTSLSDPKDILKGLESGADNFIVKPYDEEFLLSRIEYVLANQELRQQAGDKAGTEIFFAGHKYQLTSERIHSIDLLLSTYETAVQKNLELSRAKETLEQQATELREKNSQLEADLDMARELQTAFLPKTYPAFPAASSAEKSALRFCHRYTTTTELGGDFFDIVQISETQAGVFICDVMGHGVRAALVTAIIRGLVEELMPFAADPGRFLTEMNDSLCAILKQTITPLFASAFYAVIDLSRGVARHANAGHPSPFHLRRSEAEVARLAPTNGKPGAALGVIEKSRYDTAEQTVAAGDLLMLFTDGIYEVEGAAGDFYDQGQLAALVAENMKLGADALFDEVLKTILHFSAAEKFDDDVCLVAIEIVRIA